MTKIEISDGWVGGVKGRFRLLRAPFTLSDSTEEALNCPLVRKSRRNSKSEDEHEYDECGAGEDSDCHPLSAI